MKITSFDHSHNVLILKDEGRKSGRMKIYFPLFYFFIRIYKKGEREREIGKVSSIEAKSSIDG